MLRIEKVFIQGFKSFCDPTEVIFDAEGITAVVGPNGCGKSNVSDALSWVIGEQRAKALRGGKMEDVIFQGSRNRQPSGLAEVMLTLRVETSFEIRLQEKPEKEIATPSILAEKNEADLATEQEPPLAAPQPQPVAKSLAAKAFQAGEKITIARRLYRTGESEYEMNGRTCRLRDIQDLFAGTGLGAAHYAIIEQGRIGQVLSAKPLDRRSLIEEAAGISKFKMRQRSAELKLEAAQQNLSRVTDIIAEVERQQGTLKRQAAKARRYQRLRTEMRALTKAVLVGEYQQTQQFITELMAAREIISQQEAEVARVLQETDVTKQAALNLANQFDSQLTEDRAVAAETNLQIEKARQQQIYLQAQIASLSQRQQQASHDRTAINERSQLLTQERERLQNELRAIEEEINIEAARLSQVEKEYAEQSSQDQFTEKQLEVAQRNVTEMATQRERWSQLVRQFTEARERSQKTLNGLKAEQVRTTEQATKVKEEYEVAKERLRLTEEDHQQTLNELSQVRELLASKQVILKEQEVNLTALQKKLTEIEQRLKSLVELDDRRAYFSETIQAIIQEAKKKTNPNNFKIIGTLADFIKVSPEAEKLVEVGLKDELQYLLTPTFEDALKAIDFLKRGQHGRATFLVLNATPKSNAQEVSSEAPHQIIRLIDLLGLKPELRKIVQQALPRLSQTVVADQLDQAITASISTNGKGNSFLTPTGEFISAGHIISGGSFATQGSGILALKREIEELALQEETLTNQIYQKEEITLTLKTEVNHLNEQNQILDAHQRNIEKILVQQRATLSQLEREIERTASHSRVVEIEIQQAELEYTEFETKLSQATIESHKAGTLLTEAEAQAAAAGNAVVQVRQQAAERMQRLASRRADFAAKSEKRKGLQQDIRRLENEGEEISKRLSRLQMDDSEAETQTQNLQESLLKLSDDLATLVAEHQLQVTGISALADQLAREKEKLAVLESALTTGREEITALREKRAEIDIHHTKRLASLEHLEAACHAELGASLEVLVKQQSAEPDITEPTTIATFQPEETEEIDLSEPISFHTFSTDFDLATGKKQLEELRTKVESLGPVNLLALQELGEQEERLSFLLEQKADIEQAVTDTLSVITELKKRSRERFSDAFHQINRNFSEMFLELFGGGHGEMRLIDESDILESGIDIIAQPPGKRLQNVLLLSGGEKAMAALALIMGIFKYRPSPFCLLDEVDAPLDDVNIGRFADKILEMSQNTQFMVITHSKRTMEAAKTLYGVTMEDPGVSKLISVRLT